MHAQWLCLFGALCVCLDSGESSSPFPAREGVEPRCCRDIVSSPVQALDIFRDPRAIWDYNDSALQYIVQSKGIFRRRFLNISVLRT